MFHDDKNDRSMNTPKKTFSFIKDIKYYTNDNSPLPDLDNKRTNEDSFSSPLSKTNNTTNNKNNYNYKSDNKNYIYSPYVKRINISENKEEGNNKIEIKGHISNIYLTSYKKFTKKIYSPSPNINKSEKLSDRFIPLNKGINLLDKFNLTTKFIQTDENKNSCNGYINEDKDNNEMYDKMLKANFLNEYNAISFNYKNEEKNYISSFQQKKLFSFKENKSKKFENFFHELINAKHENENILTNKNFIYNNDFSRKISTKPYKELPAQNLMDDFYLNLLDWSSKNLIAVACTSSVILWNNNKTQSETLLTYDPINNNATNNEIYASSLIWSEDGEKLAVGNSCGQIELYDINKKEKICSFKGHSSRVGVVAWNKNLISSGSKDFSIITRDIRCKNDDENIIRKFYGHNQEVCGLKWSFDGSQLASGGNDNNLMIWNLHSNKPLMSNSDHIAAVKAIAWSPHQHNILASGGGTADRTIRFWNTNSFEQISKIDTGSQVCNLVFSKTSNELVSTHGYSLNQINIWKLPNMEKITTLNGHSFRVLYLGLSPDGTSIVTGAGDKRLKFWNVFPPFKKNYNSKLFPSNRDFR
jgi:cell division cycle 20-like protein 1 (cofactor of APC complex)